MIEFNERTHRYLLLIWFPAWIVLLTLLFQAVSEHYHSHAVIIFKFSTLLVFALSYKRVKVWASKPEFWLIILSLVLTLLSIEVGIRLIPTHSFQYIKTLGRLPQEERWRFAQHHYSLYTMNTEWNAPNGDNINSHGYRGEEITIPKPDHVYRIVAVGGSTTYGETVGLWRDSYPAQLEQVLHEEYGYHHIEVINAGIPGYNSWETLMNLEFRVLDLNPDMIILYQNTNDVHARLTLPGTYQGDNSGRRTPWNYEIQASASQWALQVPSILWRLVGISSGLIKIPPTYIDPYVNHPCTGELATVECLGMEPINVLEANPPIYYERNLRSMIGIAQANDINILFVTWAYTNLYNDYASRDYYEIAFVEHNEVMRRLATEFDILFYDFGADMPYDIEYWADGRHMTTVGNRLKAELIARYLISETVLPRN